MRRRLAGTALIFALIVPASDQFDSVGCEVQILISKQLGAVVNSRNRAAQFMAQACAHQR